jgi:ABC-type transport system involved in multi-copper enzyme maturation permease subunit
MSERPWRLWRTQMRAVMRLELKKTLFTRRGIWVYLLAFSPALIYAAHSLFLMKTGRPGGDIGEETHVFAGVFQLFYLRLAIFFGCVGIFMNLFRGEVLDKSLHYYFLTPVRRAVLLAGKFLSGLLAAALIFGTSILLQFAAEYWHFEASTRQEYFFHGHGLEHLAAYLGVTLLACLGYGGVFLAAGVMFRNPLLPTVAVLVWEAINAILPAALQRISVIFYLKSLCPVPIPGDISLDHGNPLGFIAMNPSPASALMAVVGLLALSVAAFAFSARQLRRMEIDYGSD